MQTVVGKGMELTTRKIRFFLLVCMIVLSLSGCGRVREARMYREVLTNKSIMSAKDFFERYPESPYTDDLVDQLVLWCKQESSPEMHQIVLEILPVGHPGARELEQLINNQKKELE